MENKQLRRSVTNKVFFGVCGGIGEYFGIDPTLVRLAFILLAAVYGGGLLAYIIAALVIPKPPYAS